jgi:hypothetical protein
MKLSPAILLIAPIFLFGLWAFSDRSKPIETTEKESDWVLVRIHEPFNLGIGSPAMYIQYADGKTEEILLRKRDKQSTGPNSEIIYNGLDKFFKKGFKIEHMSGGDNFTTIILKK